MPSRSYQYYSNSEDVPKAGAIAYDEENKQIQNSQFDFVYEGINGRDYKENVIAPSDAGTYKVTATLNSENCPYSGEEYAEFTIFKADSINTEAYISLLNNSKKTIKIDENFILSYMAAGAKISQKPSKGNGNLIESLSAEIANNEFTLKSKEDAANGSNQIFELELESKNYKNVTVKVTVYNDNVVVKNAKLKNGKIEFLSGVSLLEVINLSDCSATINGTETTGEFELMEPDQKLIGTNE